MEISGISPSAASAASLSDGEPQAVAVLKKALDAQAQTAAALISTLPPPAQPGSSPPNVGQNIDIAV
ncbi:MAG: YjfB family protein [Nitrospirae bacterium]|nr:YjfB family protein [Nitrospirota bacterium]